MAINLSINMAANNRPVLI